MANRYRYPTGVRPLLVREAARRKTIESRCVSLLEADGFEEVLLPIIDYVEPYAPVVSREASRQSYRFVDREGELVAIRSDFTPMVARALAPSLTPADLPLRVFYRGDVIRCEATRLGVNREMFQIGAEIVGDASVEADIAAVSLAARSIAAFGIRPLVVYTDVGIAETLIRSAANENEMAAIRSALISKRTAGIKGTNPLAERIAAGEATLDDVAAWGPTARIAERLRLVGNAVRDLDFADFALHLDDVEPASGYYTGIRFRVYGDESRARLGQGGRYDELYGRFGTAAPAIGFTFTIDDLAENAQIEQASSTEAPAAAIGRQR